jgi:hypothetical protein
VIQRPGERAFTSDGSLTLQGAPLLSQGVFSAVVLMVLVATLVAPVGLRWAFGDRKDGL